jgi:putative transcriptional regulator
MPPNRLAAEGTTVNEDRFNKMMEGVKQGADILEGRTEPSRVFKATVQVPDVKAIRNKLDVTQPEFAKMLGISVRTLQNWEQNRRTPVGPARILLEMAAAYPDKLKEVSGRLEKQIAVASVTVTQ